ncbi:aggrecan core protein-like [Cyprinodon tularosa]|uniref:aggrecan core protein-like n=1 Tax=Cyprinodon tularosa TaxID=77115 RepID=UPI0018E1E680|nr:aggrecan core protein-like [Cyprinodon tularosa]
MARGTLEPISSSIPASICVRKNISAEAGQTVTLPCQHPFNYTVLVVQWRRTDLGDEYVLLYRDEQIDESNQNPSYSDRVNLQDSLMEDRDVSLLLEDVKTYDIGIYECRVVHMGSEDLEDSLTCIIGLDVSPPPLPPLPLPGDGNKEDGGNDDEEYEEKNDEGNKAEKIQMEENEKKGNEGSIVLPVFFGMLLSIIVFQTIRGYCVEKHRKL